MLSMRESLEGERKQVTVLFADLRSSLELQDLPAGAAVDRMDRVPFDNNLAVREVEATRPA